MGELWPAAYFITFTTYGTRVHGDPRGSVHHSANQRGAPTVEPSVSLQETNQARLVNVARKLDDIRRQAAMRTIVRVCEVRGWVLLAANVRTNHVHVVVVARLKPEFVLNALKVWISRDLAEAGLSPRGERLWTRHGSTRYLWKTHEVSAACAYVVHGQGANVADAFWPLEAEA